MALKMTERIIGIDFGTSTTVVKWKIYENGKPKGSVKETKHLSFRGRTCPTVVLKKENGEYCFGDEATDTIGGRIHIYENFKITLSDNTSSNYNELIDVLFRFFKYLHKEYSKQCSEHVDKEITYLSFPAKFPEPYKKNIFEAARKAGFINIDFIDEPTAAIHAFLTLKLRELQESKLINENQEYTFMIIDMGAGTTDFAICRHDTGLNKTTVLSVWPSADYKDYFGGSEVDLLIYNYFLNLIMKNVENIDSSRFNEKEFIRSCKIWKDYTLLNALKTGEDIPKPTFINILESVIGNIPIPKMNLQTFLSFSKEYFEKFPVMVNDCLSETAEMNKKFSGGKDVDFIVLTGGHSQWCFLPDMLMNKIEDFIKINLPKICTEELIFRMELPGETVADGMVYKPLLPKFAKVAANNVWIRFLFKHCIRQYHSYCKGKNCLYLDNEGKPCPNKSKQYNSEPIKIISAGDVMPKSTKNREFSARGGMNPDFFDSSYSGTCEFLVGKNIDTALTYQKNFTAKPTGWDNFKMIISDLFGGYGFSRYTVLCFDFDITMDDKQMLSLEGSITVDGYNSKNGVNFTIQA